MPSQLIKFSKGVFNEETGYTWTMEIEGATRPIEYRTNTRSQGLWIWDESTQTWNQTRGTNQFSLSEDPEKAKTEIGRYFNRR